MQNLLVLKPSLIDKKGFGVFAASDIKKGTRIAEGIHDTDYDDLISWDKFSQYPKDTQKKIMDFCIGTPEGFIPPENMDFDHLPAEWYFNHSCDGNLGFDDSGEFIALRDIKKREELSYDYGLAESNPIFKMECKCGNINCRKIITGNDWKDPEFRKKHINYMLPRLRK